jgi:hypothetical protein
MAKHHAAGFAQALGHRRHRVGAVAAVLAGGGFLQADAGKFAVCRQQADILKSLAAQQRGVTSCWTNTGRVFGIAAIAASSQ